MRSITGPEGFMRNENIDLKRSRNRDNEKGAALVMALLITSLLLVASAGLLLESSLNSQNVTDATAEQAAYNAAESGIQSAVNVLRGNVVPSPLIDTTKPATDPANKIDFIKALRTDTSNLSSDTTAYPRFSRWLGYDSTCNDRVVIGADLDPADLGFQCGGCHPDTRFPKLGCCVLCLL